MDVVDLRSSMYVSRCINKRTVLLFLSGVLLGYALHIYRWNVNCCMSNIRM